MVDMIRYFLSCILCAKLCREKDDIYYMYKKKPVFLGRGGGGHVCDIFFSLFLLPLRFPKLRHTEVDLIGVDFLLIWGERDCRRNT